MRLLKGVLVTVHEERLRVRLESMASSYSTGLPWSR